MAADRPARPDPLRWLWYALGGGRPPRYREWVLRDVTAPRWWLRQVVRTLVQALPVGLVVGLLIPGSVGIRLLAVGAGWSWRRSTSWRSWTRPSSAGRSGRGSRAGTPNG